MLSNDRQGAFGASKQANVACLEHYVRACVCVFMRVRFVLRVERRQIMRQGGHFHSCKAMLNTSLPLEQLPHPEQLYRGVGSAQVIAMSDSCPRLAQCQSC